MTYLINRIITFNPDNGSLKNIENSHEVFLSSLNTRILHQLINAGSDCLPREEILHHAWQQHRLIPAPATLNQHISLIRKTLLSVGLQERFIITIARMGYRLNSSISIEMTDIANCPLAAPIQTVAAAPSLPVSVRKNPAMLSSVYIYLLAALLIISSLLYFLINKRHQELNTTQRAIYIGNINHCPIYFINKLLNKDQEAYLKFLATTQLLAKECVKDEVILAYASRSLNMSEGIGHQFIAKCSVDTKGNYYHCENEYTTL